MRNKIALFRRNSKVLTTVGSIPLKLRANIPKVTKLHGLGNLGVNNHGTKPNRILHKFHLNSMRASRNIHEFLLLFVLYDFIHDVGFEGCHADCWTIHQLEVVFLTGIQGEVAGGKDGEGELF
jgi:hypothetical protein